VQLLIYRDGTTLRLGGFRGPPNFQKSRKFVLKKKSKL